MVLGRMYYKYRFYDTAYRKNNVGYYLKNV